MNAITLLFITCCMAGWLPSSANAEENYIINTRPQKQEAQPAPNTTIIVPGTTTIIPNGTATVPEGNVTLPDVNTTLTNPKEIPVPDGTATVPEGNVTLPDVNATLTNPKEIPVPDGTATVPSAPSVTSPVQSAPVQLWQLMPLTNITKESPDKPEKNPPPTTPEKKPEPEKKAQTTTPEKKNEPEKKPAAKPETVKPEPKKPEPPQPVKEPTRAPRPGDPLRIPEEAIKTGNLDFLEGCWQGTRPEYYSKRIIKECFCFGKGGGSGKRRVNDPKGGRTCFGSSKAKMSGRILHVSSEGAYCSDGQIWGAAQMTCRGSGQSTPCSWVFIDAEGGEQSYEIPFVRVESCGGRR